MRSENSEMLAELLNTATDRCDGRLAESLVEDYPSLSALFSAAPESIKAKWATGDGMAVLPMLLGGIASRRITDGFTFGKGHTEEEICRYLSGLFIGCPVENIYLLTFDGKGRVLGSDFLCEGTVNASDILPRIVVERAVRRGASAVIIAHNHPGGNAKPSAEDCAATSNLEVILKTAGITLLEHYVVAEDVCVSVCDRLKEGVRAKDSR